MQKDDIRLLVQMNEDYTTESYNLGKRTFEADRCYQVCPLMLAELVDSGKAVRLHPAGAPRLSVPLREQVVIIPRVTRWFTANGLDTHHLTAGLRQAVPSNLAAFLIAADYAEAA